MARFYMLTGFWHISLARNIPYCKSLLQKAWDILSVLFPERELQFAKTNRLWKIAS